MGENQEKARVKKSGDTDCPFNIFLWRSIPTIIYERIYTYTVFLVATFHVMFYTSDEKLLLNKYLWLEQNITITKMYICHFSSMSLISLRKKTNKAFHLNRYCQYTFWKLSIRWLDPWGCCPLASCYALPSCHHAIMLLSKSSVFAAKSRPPPPMAPAMLFFYLGDFL